MENKERFKRAMARFQNFYSNKVTKNELFEIAFGPDSTVMDFYGVDEILDTITDMAALMFPNIPEEEIKEDISWYLYVAVDMKEPFISFEGKEYLITNPESLYNAMSEFDAVIAKENN